MALKLPCNTATGVAIGFFILGWLPKGKKHILTINLCVNGIDHRLIFLFCDPKILFRNNIADIPRLLCNKGKTKYQSTCMSTSMLQLMWQIYIGGQHLEDATVIATNLIACNFWLCFFQYC